MGDADGSLSEIWAYLQCHESAISQIGVGSQEKTESGEYSLQPCQMYVGTPTKMSYVTRSWVLKQPGSQWSLFIL